MSVSMKDETLLVAASNILAKRAIELASTVEARIAEVDDASAEEITRIHEEFEGLINAGRVALDAALSIDKALAELAALEVSLPEPPNPRSEL